MMRYKRRRQATRYIKRKPAQNMFDALRYANELNLPLNHFVTIRLTVEPADRAAAELSQIRGKLRSMYSYLAKRLEQGESTLAYIYAIENPEGADVHAHLLIHVPPELSPHFKNKVERIVRAVRGTYKARDVHITPITDGRFHSAMQYILKGVDAETANHFHLEEIVDQGEVHGQRAGTSRNIGLAARDEAGWVPPRAKKTDFKLRRYKMWMRDRIAKRRAQQRKNAEARRRTQLLNLRELQTSMSA